MTNFAPRLAASGLLLLALCHAACVGRGARTETDSRIPQFEKALTENIVGFWYPKCLDKEHGGYAINFGPKGETKPGGTKTVVTQARTVWLFSRVARAGYRGDGWGTKEMLQAADWGYRFLLEKMWDAKHGGFYWEVDIAGDRKLKPAKHLYGQSFGLYAISEYYLASGRKDVLDFAVRFFNLLEEKSHDKTYGGYIESFNEDWTKPPDGEPTYMRPAGMKLMNTHMHMMEALTTFYRASKLPPARERLLELITILSNTVIRKEVGACTDRYDRNWQPRLEGDDARISYGHDLENIWLLMDANDAVGMPNHPMLDLYRTLFAYSLRYGYDGKNGGFYESGRFREPADRRNKIWWVEAEALVSALRMYEMTKDPVYFQVFEKTWDFVNRYQIDWANGEWHGTVTPQLTAMGDKANIWKAGYHNGRAMIECLETLRDLAGTDRVGPR
jgi:mannose/cellobiose epimerase-like protein (N-acyl-D-glucosamine 2-epimerase family)